MFCHNCGVSLKPQKKQRSRGVQVLLTLLVCLGYIGIYFGITLLVEFVYSMIVMSKSGMLTVPGAEPDSNFFRLFYEHFSEMDIIASLLTLAVFAIILKATKKSIKDEIRLNSIPTGSFVSLALFGVSAQVVVTVLISVLYSLKPSLSEYSAGEELNGIFEYGGHVTVFLCIAVVVPLLEETLFRGLVYANLRKVFPVPASVIISAVIFGAAHGNLEQFAYAVVLGIVLAYVYEKFDSLWASFAIHMAFNGASFLMSLFESNDGGDFLVPVFFVSLGIMMVTSLYFFKVNYKSIKAGTEDEAV